MAIELKPIVIDNFQKGMSKSEFIGHSVIAGLNNNITGVLTLANQSSEDTGLVFDTSEYPVARDGDYWITATNAGYNYFYTGGGTPSKSAGYTKNAFTPGDIKVYNGKVYVTNSSGYVSVYTIAGGTWNIDLYTLPSAVGYNFYPMLVGNDDKLYFGANQKISSYNGSSFSSGVCTLPNDRVIVGMIQFGDNILIATESLQSENNIKIYTWNRQSNLADLWLEIKIGNFINFSVVNNIVYILCGYDATLFSSVGTTATKLVSFGDYIRSETLRYNGNINTTRRWGVTSILSGAFYALQDKILYAPYLDNNKLHPFGVYSYNINTGGVTVEFSLDYTESISQSSSINARNISLIWVDTSRYLYFCYLKNHSTNGLTIKSYKTMLGNNVRENNTAGGYFDSSFYQVGTSLIKRTFNTLTVKLARKILNGEQVAISYRTQDYDDWNTLGTFNTTGQISKEFPFAVSCENIQIRAVLNQGSTVSGVSGYPVPEIAQIIIK